MPRLACLSFQGSSFWEACDKGIVAATSYLKPLGTTVDNIQLGTALTAEVIVAGLARRVPLAALCAPAALSVMLLVLWAYAGIFWTGAGWPPGTPTGR